MASTYTIRFPAYSNSAIVIPAKTTVFLSGFNKDLDRNYVVSVIDSFLSAHGHIADIRVPIHLTTLKLKGYAHVVFSHEASAASAVMNTYSTILNNILQGNIYTSYAKL